MRLPNSSLAGRFETAVNLDYLALVHTPGDGDCFYHCLSISLFGNFNASQVLRQITARQVKDDWGKISPFLPGENKMAYFFQHVKPGVMATAVQMQAAAVALSILIVIDVKEG